VRCAGRPRGRDTGAKGFRGRAAQWRRRSSDEVVRARECEREDGEGSGGFLTLSRSSGGGFRCRRRNGNGDSTAAEASSRRRLVLRVSRRREEDRVLGGVRWRCGVLFISIGDLREARSAETGVAALLACGRLGMASP